MLLAGSYYIIIEAPKNVDEPEADIEIRGTTGGMLKKAFNANAGDDKIVGCRRRQASRSDN